MTGPGGAWLVPASTPWGCCFLDGQFSKRKEESPTEWLSHVTPGSRWPSPPGLVKFAWVGSWSLPETQKRDVPPSPRPSELCFRSHCSVPRAPGAVLPQDSWPSGHTEREPAVRDSCCGSARRTETGGTSLRPPGPQAAESPRCLGAWLVLGLRVNMGKGSPQSPGRCFQQLPESLGCPKEEGTPDHTSGTGQALWHGVALPPGPTGPGL